MSSFGTDTTSDNAKGSGRSRPSGWQYWLLYKGPGILEVTAETRSGEMQCSWVCALLPCWKKSLWGCKNHYFPGSVTADKLKKNKKKKVKKLFIKSDKTGLWIWDPHHEYKTTIKIVGSVVHCSSTNWHGTLQVTGTEIFSSEGSSLLKCFCSLAVTEKETPPQLRHLSQSSYPSRGLQSPLHMQVRKDWKRLCHQTGEF